MGKPLGRSSVEAYLFAGIGIAAVVIPMNWLLRTLLVLFLAGIILDLILRSPLTVAWPKRAKFFSSAVVLILLAGTSWRQIVDDYRGPEKPDITLSFVDATDPALVLINGTGTVGTDILWQLAVFDVNDQPTIVDQKQVIQPLPIPSTKAEFMRPHQSSAPNNLFDLPAVAARAKKGDKICGSAAVTCPSCSRGHTYIIYVELGTGGWFYPIDKFKDAQLYFPPNGMQETVVNFCKEIEETIPVSDRVTIKNYVLQNATVP